MPKIELTHEEITEVLNALDSAEKSAKRAQNTGKSPQIKEVYRIHEAGIKALSAKFATAK